MTDRKTDRKTIEATVLIMALIIILFVGPILVWGPGVPLVFGIVLLLGWIAYEEIKATLGNKKGPGK